MEKICILIVIALLALYFACASQPKTVEKSETSEQQQFVILINKAKEFMQQQQYEKAINEYREAVKMRPELPEPHNYIGICYFQLGEFRMARDTFKKAISLKPDFAFAYNNLGTTYYAQSHFDEAEEAFNEALKLNPKIASAYHNLGNIYLTHNEREKAIEYYKKAFQINPAYLAASQTNIARVEQYQKGKGEVEFSSACVLASLGKTDDALDHLENAVKKGFSDWERIKNDPDLQGLKDNPRFQKLIKKK
jgi:tetratricopeptide (TPR) repeat protein